MFAFQCAWHATISPIQRRPNRHTRLNAPGNDNNPTGVAAGTTHRSITTGGGAEGVAVSPDGNEVWVSNRAADTVSVLDAASLEVLVTIPCAAFPLRVRITPDGRHALVSKARSADLAVFDVATRKEVKRIAFEREAASTEGRLFGDRFGDSSVPIGFHFAVKGVRPDRLCRYREAHAAALSPPTHGREKSHLVSIGQHHGIATVVGVDSGRQRGP